MEFSHYSYDELQEAWEQIDDEKYPERAIEIYQRINAFPPQHETPSWIGYIAELIFMPSGQDGATVRADNAELEFQLTEKTRRVIVLIQSGKRS